jgi:hypothetical protein
MPTRDHYKNLISRRELDDATLTSLANAVADLDARGIAPKDVFPLGIIAQDGAAASFEVSPDRLGELVRELAGLDLKPEIRIFPKGILAPDSFEVRATVGRGVR